jgi:hypothetical protein
MLKKHATAITGGLSHPSKMPGPAYSIPATACKTGAKLANVKGSVCEGCYALKGRYVFPGVQDALAKRLKTLRDPAWIDAMVALVGKTAWFRWHDSGDIQNEEHLAAIAEVARRTPATQHWLPTREYKTVSRYLAAGGTIPDNLTVRLSAHMVDGPAPKIAGLPTSGVHANDPPADAHACPAATPEHRALTKDGGPTCGDCRACWRQDVPHVSYPLH